MAKSSKLIIMDKIITSNEKETFNLGRALGQKCRGGEVFALCGYLGVGKTKLVQGLAQGLGIRSRVNSPTFNILKIYKVSAPKKTLKYFCHIDAYRLKNARDLAVLGISEILSSRETVTAIEWAEKVKKILPKNIKIIKIRQLGDSQREIII